ncbi:ribosylnicotinamide kinase [Coemansia sp. IMI 203386]|nr:ribosylnicotinamide kinase [Coemansia sp. IMI 203386]
MTKTIVKDADIPIDPETQLQNWDCPEAFDMNNLVETVCTARKRLENKDQLSDTDSVNPLSDYAAQWANPPDNIESLMDPDTLKDLQQLVLEKLGISDAKQIPDTRTGYVTQNGVWTDPPGYFDSIVWPDFVKYHPQFVDKKGEVLLDVGLVADSENDSCWRKKVTVTGLWWGTCVGTAVSAIAQHFAIIYWTDWEHKVGRCIRRLVESGPTAASVSVVLPADAAVNVDHFLNDDASASTQHGYGTLAV